jgi:hypothetical protein
MLRIYGPIWDEIIGGWRKLHNEELCVHNLYSSPNTTRMIYSRRMGSEGHITHLGKKGAYRVLVGGGEGKETTMKTLPEY